MPKPLKPGTGSVPLGYADAPPGNPVDARQWAQEAVRNSRYDVAGHVQDRLTERKLSRDDLFHAVTRPRQVEPYTRMPQHGGTCWRLFGRDLDNEQELAVGFEAYVDEDGRRAIFCTIFPLKERS